MYWSQRNGGSEQFAAQAESKHAARQRHIDDGSNDIFACISFQIDLHSIAIQFLWVRLVFWFIFFSVESSNEFNQHQNSRSVW